MALTRYEPAYYCTPLGRGDLAPFAELAVRRGEMLAASGGAYVAYDDVVKLLTSELRQVEMCLALRPDEQEGSDNIWGSWLSKSRTLQILLVAVTGSWLVGDAVRQECVKSVPNP